MNKNIQNVERFLLGRYKKGTECEGIDQYSLDNDTGKVTHLNTTFGVHNSGFLSIGFDGKYVFAVDQSVPQAETPFAKILSFELNKANDELENVGGHDVLEGPSYVSVDSTGQYVMGTFYVNGSAAVYRVSDKGEILEQTEFIQHRGSSINPSRQEAAHTHCVVASPDGRYVLIADLGMDRVVVYRFDSSNGKLEKQDGAEGVLNPGTGPRHIEFSNSGKFVYVVSELDSTIIVFSFDANTGNLNQIQSLSTLPTDFSGESAGSDVHIVPSGEFLYVTNRGHDSIAVFSVNGDTGKLALVEHVSSRGSCPRNFAISNSGRWCIVGNQESDTIEVFEINSDNGKLEYNGQSVNAVSPACLKFVPWAVSAD